MPSNFERKARRKQQTRLTFDPVDRGSSPANTSPAKVRYELPGKKQRPTPVSSFTAADDSESEDVLSSAMKSGRSNATAAGKENQKLPFKPLPTPAKSSQQPAKVDTSLGIFTFSLSADLQSVHGSFVPALCFEGNFTNANNSLLDELDESEDEPESNTRQIRSSFIRSIDSSKKKHRRQEMGLDGAYSSSDGSAPENNAYTPSKKKVKRTPVKKTPTKARAIIIDSDGEDEPAMALPTRSNGSSAKQSKLVTLSDSSEDEIVHSTTRPSQRRQSSLRTGKASQNSPAAASSSRVRSKKPVVLDESDSDEDIRSSPPKRLARLAVPDEEDEVEEDIRSPSPRKRRARATIESEEDESQSVISPLKRTRMPVDSDDSDIVSSPPKRQRNLQQDVELSDDSDLLSPRTMAASLKKRDSISKTPPRLTRQRKTIRRHRTGKEKMMELMKRRRAGENIDAVTDSSESGSDGEDEDEELQELSQFEDEEPSPEDARKSAKPAKRKPLIQNSDGEIDTDDFVTDNEEGPLGIPLLAQIPLEFTSAAHKPIKEHFKDVVEWMIHNKINPGFEWRDPVYTTAFQKVDQECVGFASSKFVSTQWTAAFTRAIYARPRLELRQLNPGEGIDILGEAKCEACNHRKHIPTWSIQFQGKAYDKVTLEDIDQDSSSDEDSDDASSASSDDSDKASVDENGQPLLSEDKTWFSGA